MQEDNLRGRIERRQEGFRRLLRHLQLQPQLTIYVFGLQYRWLVVTYGAVEKKLRAFILAKLYE